jgi:hypothetical protein
MLLEIKASLAAKAWLRLGLSATADLAYQRPITWPINDYGLAYQRLKAWPISDR